MPINIALSTSEQESWQGSTNQDGEVYHTFNVISSTSIRVDVSIYKFSFMEHLQWPNSYCLSFCLFQVSADGLEESKILKPVSSPSGSYLYISIANKVYQVDELFSVTFNTINGPNDGYIYYMVKKIKIQAVEIRF